jgi:UDP-N-acetylglucosamine--N-acetylmuramyl-(pentapeptide) pyrophosphoryl-undecaprenol N-acetylglucosamine transferase
MKPKDKASVPKVLIMAGGTGGHIFPGLALAQALSDLGYELHWLGGTYGLEQHLVPAHHIPMDCLSIRGIRGKSIKQRLGIPWLVIKSVLRACQVLKHQRIDLVVGFGGYPTFPGGIAAFILRKPLYIHEQNAIAGLSNRLLSRIAQRVFAGFPHSQLPKQWTIGNPVRREVLQLPHPTNRFANRTGPLRVLIMGGSLGAEIFNQILPKAFQSLHVENRPFIKHQAGKGKKEALQKNYEKLAVQAECFEFIDDIIQAYSWADWVICRAGALTVSELSACGLGAWYVPLPHAVDDHQRFNAEQVTQRDGGLLLLQAHMTAEHIHHMLASWTRQKCLNMALAAYECGQRNAVMHLSAACQKILENK